jgi:hypothetical protein
MPVQVPRLREPKQAQFTLVRFLARMNAQMFGEGRRIGKGLLTQSTAVGAFAAVRTHVSGDGGGLTEATVTDWTPGEGANMFLANVKN